MRDISARELKGHNILAVERFQDNTRWMIEFSVLRPSTAYGIIINDLLGKLYRYDYRFGYNLLLDEENSIEKKLHTPVREEWEAEDDEI